MSCKLNEIKIEKSVAELKNILLKSPSDLNSLEAYLEYSFKHLKSYAKIIKTHLLQLEEILKTENHNYKSIENIHLSEQIKGLMKTLNNVKNEDLDKIEELKNLAKEWKEEEAIENAKIEISQEQAAAS